MHIALSIPRPQRCPTSARRQPPGGTSLALPPPPSALTRARPPRSWLNPKPWINEQDLMDEAAVSRARGRDETRRSTESLMELEYRWDQHWHPPPPRPPSPLSKQRQVL